jgi:RNA polymerase sigma factor (sigma-70 family)
MVFNGKNNAFRFIFMQKIIFLCNVFNFEDTCSVNNLFERIIMEKLTFDIIERMSSSREGNQAFELLRRQLERPVVGYARRYLDEADAKDMFQNTCAAVLQTYHNAKKTQSAEAFQTYVARDFESYFMQTGKQQVFTLLEKRKKHRFRELGQQAAVVEQALLPLENLEINDKMLKIDIAIKQLGEDCRNLIHENFFLGWKLVASAEERGVNKDSIRVTFKRCLEKIKKWVESQKNK